MVDPFRLSKGIPAVARLLLTGGIVVAAVLVIAVIASIVVGIVFLVRYVGRQSSSGDKQQPHLSVGPDGYGSAIVMPAGGGVAWTAASPAASDRWVSVTQDAEGVVATSRNGMRVTFDPGTGQVLAATR